VLSTTVTVEISYRMYDRSGQEIWSADKRLQYTPHQQTGGHPVAVLIAAAVTAAMTKAAPNYMPLAQEANQQVFILGPTAIPDGPYSTQTKKPGG
jgi:hypothetical protein